jgi:protein-L-isoaspartate(D-aspartate) O-methyltransferase
MEQQPISAVNQAARKAMIDSQLRTSGVNEEFVLRRMAEVPRENFVPAAARGVAYVDRAIPLAGGGALAAPLVQGMMLQQARPRADDKALLVDGGSLYLAELLRPLVGSLEIASPADAVSGNGRTRGFTLLVIDGAVEHVPASLAKRLADDARVVTGLLSNGITRMAVGRKAGGDVALMTLGEIGMPVLGDFAAPKAWSF